MTLIDWDTVPQLKADSAKSSHLDASKSALRLALRVAMGDPSFASRLRLMTSVLSER
jgi:hypothetical protein